MVGDFRDHRHLGPGPRQNGLVDPRHVGRGQGNELFDPGFRPGFILEGNDDAKNDLAERNLLVAM